jgi:hypothetical protein
MSRLTVLYPTRNRNRDGSVFYVCRCKCGNTVSIIRPNRARSCGCLSTASLALGRTKVGVETNGAKLNDDAVRDIRRQYDQGGISQRELAGLYGVCQMQVSKIVRRVDWRHVA